MDRKPDWRPRLFAAVEESRAAGAVENCSLPVADAIKAMTGEDPLGEIGRGSIPEQRRALKAAGAKSFDDYLDKLFGKPIPAPLAQVGDVAVFRNPDQPDVPSIGVVLGPHVAVMTEEGVMGSAPIDDAEKAYRV